MLPGATTLYLNEHLRRLRSEKRYYALDTFAGFRDEDVEGERRRGRTDYAYENFRRNSFDNFERTMAFNQVTRVSAFQVDAKQFDYSSVAPFSFVLIDVDLYEPVPSRSRPCRAHDAGRGHRRRRLQRGESRVARRVRGLLARSSDRRESRSTSNTRSSV